MTRRIQKRQKITAAAITARIRDFQRNIRKVAPHWLDETAGMAKGAAVTADDILMLNCLPPGFYPATAPKHSCTSFVSIGRTENRLFKIRDERNHIQCFYIVCNPDGKTIQVGKDIGNLGTPHFLSDAVLAGANNTGSHTPFILDAPLLNDCHILRYFGEKASSCDDIPSLFERLIDKKVAGGAGKERGAIYLFADPEKGLMMETHSTDYTATFIDKGVLVVSNHFFTAKARPWISVAPNTNTLRRKQRMDFMMKKFKNTPSLQEVFAMSRDRKYAPHALCNDDRVHFWMTISAQLHVISRRYPPDTVNYMCCGNTRHSVYAPVPLSFKESYIPLLNGDFYREADRLYRRHLCRPHMQAQQQGFERFILTRTDYRAIFQDAYDLIRSTR